MTDNPESPPRDPLAEEIRALRREVEVLNGHRFIRVQNSLGRALAFQFMRGLFLGLGTVIGASVLVSVLAYTLSQIDFLPIIGEWAADFAEEMEGELRARRSAGDANGPE